MPQHGGNGPERKVSKKQLGHIEAKLADQGGENERSKNGTRVGLPEQVDAIDARSSSKPPIASVRPEVP